MSGKLCLKKSWIEHTRTLTSWAKRKGSLLTIVFISFGMIAICSPTLSPGGLGLSSGSSATKKTVTQLSENKTEEITIAESSGKTVWDWLSLLGVPLSLVLLGAWFQNSQQQQAKKAAQKQQKQSESRAGEEALQLYLDRISDFLLNKNLLGLAKNENVTSEQKGLSDSAVTVIRAITLSILRRFSDDKERKTSVIRFLLESGVISKLELSLEDADLNHINLFATSLGEVNLDKANLSHAKLGFVTLSHAKLRGANLSNADLCSATLKETILSNADLSDADLRSADLGGADLRSAILSNTDLRNAVLRNSDLSGTDLRSAKMDGAKLIDTIVTKAKFGLNHGLSEEQKQDFIQKGAVFDNAPTISPAPKNTPPDMFFF